MQRLTAVLSFLVRPSIFLVVGLAVGYYLGYSDAFRDNVTLGDRISTLVYKIHPDAASKGIRQRASVIRDTVQSKALDGIPPN